MRCIRTGLRCVLAALLVAGLSASAPAEPRKCHDKITTESGKFARAYAKALSKFRQHIVDSGAAPTTPLDSETLAAIATAEATLRSKVAAACGGADDTCGTGVDDDPLTQVGWGAGFCPAIGSCAGPVTHCGHVSDCIICTTKDLVNENVSLTYDPLATGAFGTGSAANKCQLAIAKRLANLLKDRAKALEGCWRNVAKGRASGPCPNPGDGIASAKIAKAELKARTKICAQCGGSDGLCDGTADLPLGDVLSAVACPAGHQNGGPDCSTIGTPSSLAQVVDCALCFTGSTVDCAAALGGPGLGQSTCGRVGPPISIPPGAVQYSISPLAQAWLALVIDNSLALFADAGVDPAPYATDYAAIASFRLSPQVVTLVPDVDGSKSVIEYTFGAYDASDGVLFLGEVAFIEGRTPRPDNPIASVAPEEDSTNRALYDLFDPSPVDQLSLFEAGYGVAALRVIDKTDRPLFDARTHAIPMWGGTEAHATYPSNGLLIAEAHVGMWLAQAAVHDYYLSVPPVSPLMAQSRAATRLARPWRRRRAIRPRPLGGGVPAGQGNYRFDGCRGWAQADGTVPAYTRPKPRQNTFPWAQPDGPWVWIPFSGWQQPEGRCGQTSASNYFNYWEKDVSPVDVIDDYPWSCADTTPGTRPNTLYKCMDAIAKQLDVRPAPTSPLVDFDWHHPHSDIRNDDTQLRDWVKTLANGAPRPIVLSKSQTWDDFHWMNLVGYGDFEGDFWVVLMDGNYEEKANGQRTGRCFFFYKWAEFKAMWAYNVWGYPSYVYIGNTPAPPTYVRLTMP